MATLHSRDGMRFIKFIYILDGLVYQLPHENVCAPRDYCGNNVWVECFCIHLWRCVLYCCGMDDREDHNASLDRFMGSAEWHLDGRRPRRMPGEKVGNRSARLLPDVFITPPSSAVVALVALRLSSLIFV